MTHPRIVAVETSGRCGSAALARGPDLVAECNFSTEQEHARDLLPTLDTLCRRQGWAPNAIDQCHVSIGPGSFTGLRVAVTFARHLALATGANICAVPTLDVIAENCIVTDRNAEAAGAEDRATDNPAAADRDDEDRAAMDGPCRPAVRPRHLAVVLDAKRRQVYAAVYQFSAGAYRRIMEPSVIEPARLFADAPDPIAVIGEGIDYHREAVEASGAEVLDRALWRPRAANVHRLGWRLAQQGRCTPARQLVPFYLRRPAAEELWNKRHGPPPTK